MSQLNQWQITVNGMAIQGAMQYKLAGVPLAPPGQVLRVNFIGAGVSAAINGGDPNQLDVTITGGGGGPTVISADTIKNVPADFATFQAALAFAASAIYTNGAILTITVDGGTIITGQTTIKNVDMSNVRVQFNPAVTFDTTGYVVNYNSTFRAAIVCINAVSPEFSGSIGIGNVTVAIFAGAQQDSRIVIGSADGRSLAIANSFPLSVGATGSDAVLNRMNSGGVLFTMGATGVINNSAVGSVVAFDGSRVNLQLTQVAAIAGSPCLDSVGGSKIVANSCTYGPVTNKEVFIIADSEITDIQGVVNLPGGVTAGFATLVSGSLLVENITVNNGPSAGARFTVSGGAIVQANNTASLTAAYGADSQAALVPTAAGLILA